MSQMIFRKTIVLGAVTCQCEIICICVWSTHVSRTKRFHIHTQTNVVLCNLNPGLPVCSIHYFPVNLYKILLPGNGLPTIYVLLPPCFFFSLQSLWQHNDSSCSLVQQACAKWCISAYAQVCYLQGHYSDLQIHACVYVLCQYKLRNQVNFVVSWAAYVRKYL